MSGRHLPGPIAPGFNRQKCRWPTTGLYKGNKDRSGRRNGGTIILGAIAYLANEELDWLLRTEIQEANRRGRPIPLPSAGPTNRPAALSTPMPSRQGRPEGRPISEKLNLPQRH
jgi:hypothetical protein